MKFLKNCILMHSSVKFYVTKVLVYANSYLQHRSSRQEVFFKRVFLQNTSGGHFCQQQYSNIRTNISSVLNCIDLKISLFFRLQVAYVVYLKDSCHNYRGNRLLLLTVEYIYGELTQLALFFYFFKSEFFVRI